MLTDETKMGDQTTDVEIIQSYPLKIAERTARHGMALNASQSQNLHIRHNISTTLLFETGMVLMFQSLIENAQEIVNRSILWFRCLANTYCFLGHRVISLRWKSL